MTMMASSEAAQSMRIRAEEVLERKGTGASRGAGELAGQFAAMLEALNGVSGTGTGDGEPNAGSATQPVQPAIRLGVGAVTLFAQEENGAETAQAGQATPDPQGGDPAAQVVASAIQAGDGSNFRWLTTLLTQSGA
ncbi:hypothetical protein [Azospirillum thermophilum]|uniref:Uncharacterized protein n=1 Tax=Azospirillum thermophilum TaxID=2202148 RepID=A0A2S2CWF5_9PROT|nr:hypothetical protein [Azospirillum thermophilum]AWK88806.1 hypothetical protein DEW08_22285 [Azospirillum thermophilum]